jgi:hypothetical protein
MSDPMLVVFYTAQDIAFKVDPTLTGDHLDRIGNLVSDQAPTLADVTPIMILKAICRVKHNVMEK